MVGVGYLVLGFQLTAISCALSICDGVIFFSTKFLFFTPSLYPLEPERLNHICANTLSCGTPCPKTYITPKYFWPKHFLALLIDDTTLLLLCDPALFPYHFHTLILS